MDKKLISLFDRAQRATGKVQVKKLLVDLQALREKAASFEEFFGPLKLITNNLLIVFKREAAVERSVEFLVSFIAGDGLGDIETYDSTLLNSFVEYITGLHDAKDKAVRFRACQILSRLLHSLPEEAELDDEWFDAIQAAGLARIMDKVPAVRMQAANMLTRLQDPSNAEDPISEAYLLAIEKDASPDVRRCVLSQIGPSKKNIKAVLAATRDKAPAVRQEAYRYIKQKVSIKALRVEDRLKLLKEGLGDRQADARAECVSMLCTTWLDSKAETKLEAAISLFKQLDVMTATDTCMLAAKEIIEFVRDWPLTADDFKKLDCETAFFWRALVSHANTKKKEEMIESLTPAVPSFATMLQKWGEHCSPDGTAGSEEQRFEVRFIAEQLLWIARDLDYSDEAGRSKMTQAIRELLITPTLPESVVSSAVDLLKEVCYTESDRVQLITELIEDLRHPIQQRVTAASKAEDRTRRLEATRIKLRLNECKVELDEKVRAQEFAEAGRIKEEIQSLEQERKELEEAEATSHEVPAAEASNDPIVVVSCLLLAKHLLLTTSDSLKRAELTGLMHSLIIPGVKSTDPDIRCGALACLGMCLVLAESPTLAQEHLQMFLMILALDQDIIKKVALKAIFDSVLAFGVDSFRPQTISPEISQESAMDGSPKAAPVQEQRSTSLIQILQPYLHNEDEEIRTIAVEGFGRLMLQNHVTCPSVFSQLVELYFNPMTKDDQHLQQSLAIFFPAYAFSSSSHAAVIEAAFLPTLRKVIHAPRSSPLHAVKDITVAKFFLFHTGQHEGVGVSADEESVHATLGTKILNEMLSDPSGPETRVLSSVLSMLSLEHCTDLTVQNLTVLTELLCKAISGAKPVKSKVKDFLERLSSRGAAALTEEQIAEVHAAMATHRDEREAEVGAAMVDTAATPPTTRRGTRKSKRSTSSAASVPQFDLDANGSDEEGETENNGEDPDNIEAVSEDEQEYEVEALLDSRKSGRYNEYLVKWKGYSDEHNTWERTKDISPKLIKDFKAQMAAQAKSAKSVEKKETNKSAKALVDDKKPNTSAKKKEPKRATRSKHEEAKDPVEKQQELEDLENEVDDLLSESPVKSKGSRRSRGKSALSDVNAEVDLLLGD